MFEEGLDPLDQPAAKALQRAKAVAYLRTSTDDKGQDPQRQAEALQAWAALEEITLEGFVTDEGTSGATDPFQRPRFQEALQRAKETGCGAIVVESPDRLTRDGIGAFHVAAYRLREEYGLKLWVADQSLAQQESLAGQIVSTIKAAMAKDWLDQHKTRVRQGMQRAAAGGAVFGRPRKPLTADEVQLARTLKAQGEGVRKIALEINRRRGVYQLADPKARIQREISYGLVQRALHPPNRENSPGVKEAA